MANNWYAYNGVGDPTVASSYRKINGLPGCAGGAEVCAIYTTGGNFPTSPLTGNILSYIASGQAQLVAQPQSPAGSKLFVYMRAS